MLIKFDRPISLKPYYERYKESPREVMVEVNELVRSKIQALMLHVEDLEHYDQIDFLRETEYGRLYARRNGFKPNYLPSRLLADQQFVDKMQRASEEQPEEMERIYADVREYALGIKHLGIRDWLFRHNPGLEAAILRGLGLIILLPLFIISIIPTCLMFIIPKIFINKLIKDNMFISSFNIGVSAFISVPICLVIPVVLLWVFLNFWWALGYFVAFPLMFILAWNYMRLFIKFVGTCRFIRPKNRQPIKELRELRGSIYKRLDAILG